MAELNPITLWRRFLALPNESRGKTLGMAFLVSAASALAVSTAAVVLGPRLDANREAERAARLEALIGALPGLADVLRGSGAEALEAIVVDLATGTRAEGIDPETFDPAGPDAQGRTTPLPPDRDLAGLGERPDLARIYVARDADGLALVILPVSGQGYQSMIRGYLALEGDLNTVAGLTITDQAETPGLGARIADQSWQDLWPGTKLMDDAGEIRLAVAQGGATTEYQVDGITGATRTGSGVQNMIRFWIGPDGFGPVLDALKDGRL